MLEHLSSFTQLFSCNSQVSGWCSLFCTFSLVKFVSEVEEKIVLERYIVYIVSQIKMKL